MKIQPRSPRQALFSLWLALLAGSSVHVDGSIETAAQAQAQEKFFAKEMEMEREANNPSANDQPTLQKLGSLKLDHIHWENTDVQAALSDLTLRSKNADPDHIGLQFTVRFPADAQQGDKLGRVVSNNVCIILSEKTSLYELLMDISAQTNLAFRVQKGLVIFRLWQPGDCFYLLLYGVIATSKCLTLKTSLLWGFSSWFFYSRFGLSWLALPFVSKRSPCKS